MKTGNFESQALGAIEYHADRGILWVQFRDQSTYEYTGVPALVHEALLTASSKGEYFNRAIRGRFPHTRVKTSAVSSLS